MLISIKGFLNSSRLRADIVIRGSRFSDKVRLTLISLFDSIPRMFLRKFPLLKYYDISVIKENLVKGVIVSFEGFYYIDVRVYLFFHPILRAGCGNSGLDVGSVFVDVGANNCRYGAPLYSSHQPLI